VFLLYSSDVGSKLLRIKFRKQNEDQVIFSEWGGQKLLLALKCLFEETKQLYDKIFPDIDGK